MRYDVEEHGEQGRVRHGMPQFYALLERMAVIHDKKSHDYASRDNPAGNYHFAGRLALLFSHSEQDAGFIGRLGEKYYRLANLESSQKTPQNEGVADTEDDICVITLLWMADRRARRAANQNQSNERMMGYVVPPEMKCDVPINLMAGKHQMSEKEREANKLDDVYAQTKIIEHSKNLSKEGIVESLSFLQSLLIHRTEQDRRR